MRPLATTLVTALAVLAGACTLTNDLDGLSGGSGAAADDDDDSTTSSGSSSGTKSSSSGNATSSASSASSSTGSSGATTSSSGSMSSGTPSSNLLINETFPNEDACEGWTEENTSAHQFRPDLGHDAKGACQVCGGGGDFFLTKTVTAPKAGKLSAQMFVRAGEGAPVSSATIALATPNGNVSSSKNVGADFALFTSGNAAVKEGAAVTVKIGLSSGTAGQCLVFDDVQVSVN